MSRASMQTHLAFCAVYILASDAIGPVNAPCSCSCAIRKHISWMAVTSASMLANLFCTNWYPAIGLPNCSRLPA